MTIVKVRPLRNEKPPMKRHLFVQPPDTFRYKVRNRDTWITLSARYKQYQWFDSTYLTWLNFGLNGTEPFYTDQVNWYLREYVGCRHSFDGGKNWAFTDDADPGYIFLPHRAYTDDPQTISGRPGLGGVITAPQYDDQNAYDALSKALDIFTVADAGIQIWQVPIGALAEAGFIVAASLAAVIAPAVAIGSGHNDALRKTSRDFFFTGFCSALVMRADGWKTSTVEAFFPEKQYPPLNSVYPEKRETFRKLYNFGLKAGALQARRMSVEDKMNLFTFLRLRLTDAERLVQYPKGDVPSWSQQKQKDYYVRLASIMKDVILTNNLQVKVS
jgi:hypothetical protein